MNRKKKLLRNILFIVIFASFILLTGMFYINPAAAHRGSERSVHYGPSEIVHVEDFPGGKYFLGKYNQWISCNIINRTMGIFWSSGGDVTGSEIKYDNPLFYVSQFSQPNARAFGILHDQSIDKVEVHLTDGTILTQKDFYEDMFLLTWKNEAEFHKIVAYDHIGSVIFQEERIIY